MTVAPLAPAGSGRMRIAITSPDIVARIRQVFADRNLEVDIVRAPYVEVVVRPASGPPPAARAAGRPLEPRRLVAEYRLIVVADDSDGSDGSDSSDGIADGSRPAWAAATDRRRPDPTRSASLGPVPPALSRRQHEVMALVSGGACNAEIAARLRVSEKTVKNHINRIFRSLGATNRVQAVLLWQRRDDGVAASAGPRGRGEVRPSSPADRSSAS